MRPGRARQKRPAAGISRKVELAGIDMEELP